jgi:cysteine-rich repeat protein
MRRLALGCLFTCATLLPTGCETGRPTIESSSSEAGSGGAAGDTSGGGRSPASAGRDPSGPPAAGGPSGGPSGSAGWSGDDAGASGEAGETSPANAAAGSGGSSSDDGGGGSRESPGGSGPMTCDTGFAGDACDRCAQGHYGPQCTACPTTPTLDCPCTGSALACAGAAQRVQLSCSGGRWAYHGTCPSNQNCNQVDGACTPIAVECAGQTGGYRFCVPPDVRYECGQDLVTTFSTTCGGICTEGRCFAPTCGDGKLENAEECDDTNSEPADGCENDCRLSRVVKVAAGRGHACALFESGDVRCWGDNGNNQLGLGNNEFAGSDHPYQLELVDLGGDARDIVAGTEHTCAVLTDDTVRCWGRNDRGQLGLGDTDDRFTHTPHQLGAISVGGPVDKLAAGGATTCALLQSGAVRCWGQNSSVGKLGLARTDEPSATMTPDQYGPISLGANATDIGVSAGFGCALLQGGSARCWGYNHYGYLGRGHTNNIGDDETPGASDPDSPSDGAVAFPSERTPATIQLGKEHACVRFTSGEMQCWGRGSYGCLGRGSESHIGDGESAVGLTDIGGAASVIALGAEFSCAIIDDELKCWGRNQYGELGYPDRDRRGHDLATRPVSLDPVSFGSRSVVDVFAGASADQLCALLDNGEVRCWGHNDTGQLGLGSVSDSPDYVGGNPSQYPAVLPPLAMFEAP